jgi:hypothetical protein
MPAVLPAGKHPTVGSNKGRKSFGSTRRQHPHVPTAAELRRVLYRGADPHALFTNPRALSFAGELKWSSVGRRHQEDAALLVNMSQASLVIEVGAHVGTSTRAWARALLRAHRGRAPGTPPPCVLVIDAWLGDLASWLQRIETHDRDGRPDDVLADGRSRLYDQFMLNMRRPLDEGEHPCPRCGPREALTPLEARTAERVIPWSATSMVAARLLWLYSMEAALVYVDTAHEMGETVVELELYWRVVAPGGYLAGDDYGWPGVKHDVDLFCAHHQLSLHFTSSQKTWWVRKPRQPT